MSGSVTTVTVALSPAELERQARERARRERQRQIRETLERTVAGMRPASAQAASAAALPALARSGAGSALRPQRVPANRSADADRAAASDRSAVSDRSAPAQRSEPQRRSALPDRPAAPPVPADPPVPAGAGGRKLTELAASLAKEARGRGLFEFADAAEAARDTARLRAVETSIDDAIDAADTAAVIEARVDAAAKEILGSGWTPQPADVGVPRVTPAGDTLHVHVRVENDRTAVVEMALDARAAQINGRSAETCSQENRIVGAVLTGLPSPKLALVDTPTVAPAQGATTLAGLAKRSAAKASRARQAPRP